MSDKGDNKRRRRGGAFARPSDPLDLAPMPLAGPPKVEMPETRLGPVVPPRPPVPPRHTVPPRPILDEPLEDDEDDEDLVQRSLETALGDRINEGTGDLSYLDGLEDEVPQESVDLDETLPDDDRFDNAGFDDAGFDDAGYEDGDDDSSYEDDDSYEDDEPDYRPAAAAISIRTTVSSGLPTHGARARVQTARVVGQGSDDLANLVEVNRPAEGLYRNAPAVEEDVSVFDNESDDSLFDLVARSRDEETAEDPPSDVVEFGPLGGGKVPKLVVRDRVQPENFRDTPSDEDAVVFRDTKQATEKKGPQPHAWWERSTPGATPAPERPVPGRRKTWRTPGELDLRKSVRSSNRSRMLRLGGLVLVLGLCAIAAFALVGDKPTDPNRNANPIHPAEVELLEDVASGGPETLEAPETAPETPPEPEVEPEVVEPEVVEPDVVEPDVVEPEVVEPPQPEVIAATKELEEEAREALYDMGILVVTSNSRALVFVDGKRIGHTPIQGLELEPGTHRVKAVVPGRAPKYQSVRIDPGGAHQLPFSF